MIIVRKLLLRVLRRHVRRVSWGMVALALLARMGLSWVLLLLAGEHRLVGLDAFPLSVDDGPTQFNLAVPANVDPLDYRVLAADFGQRGALLLCLCAPDGALRLNPPAHTAVPAGAMLYYLAEQRVPVHAMAWQALRTAAVPHSPSPQGA